MRYTIVLTLVVAGCGVNTAEQTENVGSSKDHLYVDENAIWSSPSIPVCWENPEDWNSSQRNWVYEAVADSWSDISAVSFQGWGTCSSSSKGIRIRIQDTGPNTDGLGSKLDGRKDGMTLNFTFKNWSTSCQTDQENCIKLIAIHEFGHALGFAHEQNRPDTPSWCDQEQGSDGTVTVGSWDLDSVMNYCNPNWNGNGVLSATDILGVRAFYGTLLSEWQDISTSSAQKRDIVVGDFNGDYASDILYADGSSWRIKYSALGAWYTVSTSNVRASQLRVGDFDGDNKDDVLYADGSSWRIKYSAAGGWVTVSTSTSPANELVVGDFNGDGQSDVLWASGSSWRIKYSALGDWVDVGNSTSPASELVVGDFNGDRSSDVLWADGSSWRVKYSAIGGWDTIADSVLRNSEFLVADVNVDGTSDILRPTGSDWRVRLSATGHWYTISDSVVGINELLIGRFNPSASKTSILRTTGTAWKLRDFLE